MSSSASSSPLRLGGGVGRARRSARYGAAADDGLSPRPRGLSASLASRALGYSDVGTVGGTDASSASSPSRRPPAQESPVTSFDIPTDNVLGSSAAAAMPVVTPSRLGRSSSSFYSSVSSSTSRSFRSRPVIRELEIQPRSDTASSIGRSASEDARERLRRR